MSIETNKLMNLADGKVLYDDLRGRVDGKLAAPSTAGTSGQVLTSDGNGGQSWEDPSGVADYAELTNKPSINSVSLSGNKSTSDLGIHDIPSGGASGKILKKASATDYDMVWGDAPTATDAQVETAVDAWLGENISNPSNPPLDRSLSSSSAAAPADMVGDLLSAVNYAVVKEDSEKSFYHSEETSSVTFYPNNYTQDIAIRYCNGEDLFKGLSRSSGESNGVTTTNDGRFMKLSGTGTGGRTLFNTTDSTFLNSISG